MKSTSNLGLFALTVISFVFLFPFCKATIHYVTPSASVSVECCNPISPCNLTYAVSTSDDGDVISLLEGTYEGFDEGIFITHSLTFRNNHTRAVSVGNEPPAIIFSAAFQFDFESSKDDLWFALEGPMLFINNSWTLFKTNIVVGSNFSIVVEGISFRNHTQEDLLSLWGVRVLEFRNCEFFDTGRIYSTSTQPLSKATIEKCKFEGEERIFALRISSFDIIELKASIISGYKMIFPEVAVHLTADELMEIRDSCFFGNGGDLKLLYVEMGSFPGIIYVVNCTFRDRQRWVRLGTKRVLGVGNKI